MTTQARDHEARGPSPSASQEAILQVIEAARDTVEAGQAESPGEGRLATSLGALALGLEAIDALPYGERPLRALPGVSILGASHNGVMDDDLLAALTLEFAPAWRGRPRAGGRLGGRDPLALPEPASARPRAEELVRPGSTPFRKSPSPSRSTRLRSRCRPFGPGAPAASMSTRPPRPSGHAG